MWRRVGEEILIYDDSGPTSFRWVVAQTSEDERCSRCSSARGAEGSPEYLPEHLTLSILTTPSTPQIPIPNETGILDWNPVVWYRDSMNISWCRTGR